MFNGDFMRVRSAPSHSAIAHLLTLALLMGTGAPIAGSQQQSTAATKGAGAVADPMMIELQEGSYCE